MLELIHALVVESDMVVVVISDVDSEVEATIEVDSVEVDSEEIEVD